MRATPKLSFQGSGRCAALLTMSLALGCTGDLLGGDESDVGGGVGPGTQSGSGGGGAINTPNGTTASAGPMPLTRLTTREYNLTVRDLLGDTSEPASAFPSDKDRSFLFRRAGIVASQDAELLRSAAEALAQAAIKDPSKLLPCEPASGEQACAEKFIDSFGLRAYRRPPGSSERQRLLGLYQKARGELALGFSEAVGLLVESILQSPAFLYHWGSPEAPPVLEADLVRLEPYRIASRLSYFMWATMPDQALFDAAAAGELVSVAQLETQARRMLADPKAAGSVQAFFGDWLGLGSLPDRAKDASLYPEYDAALQGAMLQETELFASEVVLRADGLLGTLLTSKYSFVDARLAKLYELPGVTGDTLLKQDLDATRRSGLLTQPGFLAVNGATDGSHPVRRGHAVFERLMCGSLPPPPNDVPPAEPASAGGTTRERFERHAENPCGKACHSIMDPVGFAFEHYDGIGKYRTLDNGGTVDSSGEVRLDESLKPFKDAVELAELLAQSEQVKACVARQWLRYALGRTETDADAASVSSSAEAFSASAGNIRELMVNITASLSFRYRSLAQGEPRP